MRSQLLCGTMLIVIVQSAMTEANDHWPRFRGPNGTGLAPALDVPDQWEPTDYAWQAELPGRGHGSPVVYNSLVFVTSGDGEAGTAYLEAYEAATGQRVWRESLAAGSYAMHASNSYASTTPAVDAQRVFVSICEAGDVQVVAFTHAGREVWRSPVGTFVGQHGFAASPVVIDGHVCLQFDSAESGGIVALDAATGAEAWRSERPAGRESYATPAVVTVGGDKLAVIDTSNSGGIRAIDPGTGEVLWQQADALPARTVSSPLVAGSLVLATCGAGGNGHQLSVVRARLDGKQEAAYTLTRNVPYVPTAIACDELLFLWHDRGTVTCARLDTGETLWTRRVGGTFFGSPVAIGDRLLALSQEGEAVMLAASEQYQVLGRTDLREPTQATPAVAAGRLFLRTESKLMCLAETGTQQ